MSIDNSKMKKVLEQLNGWCTKHYPQVQSVYDDCAGYTLQQLVYYLLGVVKETTSEWIDVSNQFNELYNFVHDYFDNLNLQNEVNEWFESALSSGRLTEILSSILKFQLYSFDTIAEFKESNLGSGCLVYCGGFSTINDGGGCHFYTSVSEPNELHITLNNGVFATYLFDGDINGVSIGALNNPEMLESIHEPVDFKNKTLSLSNDIKVNKIKNCNIINNIYSVECNEYRGEIYNCNFSGINSEALTNKPALIISNQEIKVSNSIIGSSNSYGISIMITSEGALNNITYNVTLENVFINGGNYGIYFSGTKSITQCIFSNIKFNYVKTSGISADENNSLCAHHVFNNIVMQPGKNAIGIDLTDLTYCDFNNITMFNDAGGNIPLKDRESFTINENVYANFGYGNNLTNVNIEGEIKGEIFRNNMVHITTSTGEQRFNSGIYYPINNFFDLSSVTNDTASEITGISDNFNIKIKTSVSGTNVILPSSISELCYNQNKYVTVKLYTNSAGGLQARIPAIDDEYHLMSHTACSNGMYMESYIWKLNDVITDFSNYSIRIFIPQTEVNTVVMFKNLGVYGYYLNFVDSKYNIN